MRNRHITILAMLAGFALVSGQAFADRDGESECKGERSVRSVHSSRSSNDHNCAGTSGSTGSVSVESGRSNDGSKDVGKDSSNDGSYVAGTKRKAYLTSTIQTGAYAKVGLEAKTNSAKFETEVKLRVPSASIGINDSTAARAASVSLSLLRNGVEYASCDLDVKKAYTTRAEYKVEIANYRNTAPVARTGTCVNLSGVSVVPAIQTGDTVEIFVDTYATGPFITGTVN